MSYYNYNAVIIFNQTEFFLTKEEVHNTALSQIKWRDKNRPPLILCRRLVLSISEKYKSGLPSSHCEQLAAQIVGISYLKFTDIIHLGGA